MIITYVLGDRLYLNITNRCTNRCAFCIRDSADGLGVDLWLPREPEVPEIIAAIQARGDLTRFTEVVFCGYGEPLMRPEAVRETARFLKETGLRVRLNTNGQAGMIHGRNVVPEFAPYVTTVSISLNAPDARTYNTLCRPFGGEAAFAALLEFIRECKRLIPRVTLTMVEWPGVDTAAGRRLAEDLQVGFRVRRLEGKFDAR